MGDSDFALQDAGFLRIKVEHAVGAVIDQFVRISALSVLDLDVSEAGGGGDGSGLEVEVGVVAGEDEVGARVIAKKQKLINILRGKYCINMTLTSEDS